MPTEPYDPTRQPPRELPKRRPYAAHDAEMDEANRRGIRPARPEESGR